MEKLSQDGIDNLECLLVQSDSLIEFPVTHTFLSGMYSREIFMPAGSLLTSKIHNTEHPFVVLEGIAYVYTEGEEVAILGPGHHGITTPGTRRVLYIEEDCKWITYHLLNEDEEKARDSGEDEEKLLEMVEDRIIDKRSLPGYQGKTAYELYSKALGDQECLG